MRVAITGTPGTGKTSVRTELSRRGYASIDPAAEAERVGALGPPDPRTGVREVDIDALGKALDVRAKVAFTVSHFAHLLPCDLAIVLRCRPSVLRTRLEGRGWPAEKIRENVEAEAIDVITQEAVARLPRVYEIDTTDRSAAETADAVLGILQGRTRGHEPGSVDWSQEVLSWF